MKRTIGSLIIVCSALAALGQPAAPERERDPKGFLPADGGTNSKPAQPTAPQPAPAEAAPAAGTTEAPVLGAYVLDDKHKLFPGDRVSFQIVQDRTNSIPMLVAESSELDIPYIGRVSVAGKTCKQAAEDIKAMLEKDYYYKATVVIGLDALTKLVGRVYVFGPVRNPGPVEIPTGETFTASKAILRAGGFGDFADRKKVRIIRKSDTGTKTIMVNLENVLVKGKTEEDVPLEPEDYILVPQRSWNF